MSEPFVSKNILVGVMVGGFIGAVIGYSRNFDLATSTVLGFFIGGIVSRAIAQHLPSTEHKTLSIPDELDVTQDFRMPLREEEMDVSKEWIRTNNVTMRTEIVIEEKSITVPVTREELVVEAVSNEHGQPQTIRIPISEERIEITKHKEVLRDVEVYKRRYQDREIFEEALQKESLHIKTSGDAQVKMEEQNEESKH